MELYVFGLDTRQRYAANVLLSFLVHIGFHRRCKVELLFELRQLNSPGSASQNAIKHVVEFAAKTKQVLEQPFTVIDIFHNHLQTPASGKAGHSPDSMAAVGAEVFSGLKGRCVETAWRFTWTSGLTAAFMQRRASPSSSLRPSGSTVGQSCESASPSSLHLVSSFLSGPSLSCLSFLSPFRLDFSDGDYGSL